MESLNANSLSAENIKPSNLLFDEDGVVKLSDYGLPISLYSKENLSTLCHTAPEGFNGQRELKSDVWSLGITLLEWAAGRNPYEDAVCRIAVQYRVCQNEPFSFQREMVWRVYWFR